MKKRLLSAALALALFLPLVPAASAASQEEILQTLAALEIMEGDENGDLELDRQVTRAEFVKMTMAASIYRDGVGAASTSPYPDVPRDHWAAGYVQAAVQAGYITGYLDGTFRPNNTICLAEGVTLVLRLLGYDRTAGDFNGGYPSAELSAYRAMDLDDGVSVTDAMALLTRRDCMYLFYNLLTTAAKNGQPYLTTLGYSLTPSGEVDLVALVNSVMDGPAVASGSWQSQLEFDPASATVYRAGNLSSYSAIQENDVVYWSNPMRTLWVYTNRASGMITAISPSASAPAAVTVGGKSYPIETASAAYALSDLGGFRVGDTVTLLLGRTGGAAAVLSGSQSASGTVYGVVTGVSSSPYTDADGNSYLADTISLTATDGSTYSYPCGTSSLKEGALVQVSSSGSSVTVKRLSSSSSLSGRVSADGTSLGSYDFADNVEILDVYKQSAVRVYPGRLAGLTLSSSQVSWYQLDSRGDICRLILSDVTGDMHTYGVLTDVTEVSTSLVLSTTGVYVYDAGGVPGMIQGTKIYNLSTGPMVIRWNGTNVDRIANLTSVNLDSAAGASAQGNSQTYTLSDNLLVYEQRGSDYYLTSLNLVNNGSFTLTGYYDKAERDGGRIRVIIAK